jgi:TonB-linked SusC/RagA family outer membrane protein
MTKSRNCKNPEQIYYPFAHFFRIILLFFLLPLLATNVAFASQSNAFTQQEKYRTVTGKVKDKAGLAIPGVYVLVTGTKIGTVTSGSGEFTLNVPEKEDVLVFSLIGMEKQEVRLGDKKHIEVVLSDNVKQLDDVVAIGYQNVKRRTVTGAMTTIKSAEIENIPYASVDQILSGKIAGLTSISTSGEPGANTIVTIRGSNSVSLGGVSFPLYVIDGMIYDVNDMPSAYGNNPLTAINPNDIESIDILKDASASAIYGSRGANGVILIKTKKGDLNQTPTVRINVYTGIGARPSMRKVVTGATERRMKLDMMYNTYGHLNNTALSMFLSDSLNASFNNNRDWQSIFVQNSSLYNVDASISGAFGKNQYRVSLGYYNEEGVIIGYALKRFSPKVYLSLNPSEKVNFTINFAPSMVNIKHGLGNGNTFPFSTWDFPSSFWLLSDKEINAYRGQVNNLDDDNTTTLAFNAQLKIDLTKNLTFTSSFSNNFHNNRRDYLSSKLINGTGSDVANNWSFESTIWEIENYLTYAKQNTNNNFSVIIGQQASQQNNKNTFVSGQGVLGNTVYNLSPGSSLNANTYAEQKGRLGLFGRFNYDYKSRYLFSSSYRRDASSRYSKAKRWADFYSVSAGWIISDEEFFYLLKDVINNLKFRGSYGVIGNDPASYYAQYNIYESNATYDASSFGQNNSASATTYNGATAIVQDYDGYAAAKNVTWEMYPQVNVGVDLGLFKNRIDIQADWYARDANNIYYNDIISPITSGYGHYSGNAVCLRNTGIELTVNTNNLGINSKLKWNTNFTLAINDNYVTKLPDGGKDLTVGDPWQQYTLTIGKPLFAYRVWETTGVYDTDESVPTDPLTGFKMTYFGNTLRKGDPKYVDKNGDYNINMDDKAYAGDPNPRIVGGFTNTFSYKNWSLSVMCNFIQGRKIWNGYTSDMLNGTKTGNPWADWGARATLGIVGDINYYKGSGDTNADYGTLINNVHDLDRFHIANSKFIEDGSFFRVKNIMLGYTVPPDFNKKIGLSSLRVFGMIDNVLLLTKSSLPDPEAVGANGWSSGNNYPLALKFTFGLTASF